MKHFMEEDTERKIHYKSKNRRNKKYEKITLQRTWKRNGITQLLRIITYKENGSTRAQPPSDSSSKGRRVNSQWRTSCVIHSSFSDVHTSSSTTFLPAEAIADKSSVMELPSIISLEKSWRN